MEHDYGELSSLHSHALVYINTSRQASLRIRNGRASMARAKSGSGLNNPLKNGGRTGIQVRNHGIGTGYALCSSRVLHMEVSACWHRAS